MVTCLVNEVGTHADTEWERNGAVDFVVEHFEAHDHGEYQQHLHHEDPMELVRHAVIPTLEFDGQHVMHGRLVCQ